MVPLNQILDTIRSYHPSANLDLIASAYKYSEKMHEGQLRKSGDPYFIHPTSVALIITEMRLDAPSVCAALLHDVVEDTPATEPDIVRMFGKEVAFLVDGVTKLGRLNFASKEDQQAESFRKMLVAMASDIRVLLVKLADRLDNMRTLDAMKVDSQERIAQETIEIFAPLAGRLGVQWIKSELEDLSFRYLYPDIYKDLENKAKLSSQGRQSYIEDVTKQLAQMLTSRGFAVDASGRAKHLYSIHRKMRQSQCEFEQVQDSIAFRVVMETVADCYAALGVIHSEWTPIPGRFKDFIALPKPNMYQSLHTTVIGPGHQRIEVQIRTREMHETAENGIAAHWRYKEGSSGLDPKDAEKFKWLRQLMEVQQEVSDPAEFIESVKVDLFADEVFVFTPKGDVRVFPQGSTPLDFAFAIHSEVGEHCSGARVNGAIVPLRYKMHNGDVVEILTHPAQRPHKDWLDHVVTARARSKIRAFMRAEGRKRSIKLGRDLLEREMHKRSLSFGKLVKSGDIEKLSSDFHAGNTEEFFAMLGYGKISPAEVVDTMFDKTPGGSPKLRQSIVERTMRKVIGSDDNAGIRIDEIDNIVVRYAKCCNPLPGDAVTGWITRGRGVTVHRRECPKAMNLDTERRVEVQWSSSAQITRPVSLRVVAADRPGILAAMSAAITQSGINIGSATVRTPGDGQAYNQFEVSVTDVGALRALMRVIAKIEGVYEVERI